MNEEKQIKDQELLAAIKERFKTEKVRLKRTYADSFGGEVYVSAVSVRSPARNDIHFNVYGGFPTEKELPEKVQIYSSKGSLELFLPSELARNKFELGVQRAPKVPKPKYDDDEQNLGEILNVIIRDGSVSRVNSHLRPEYLDRLKVGDPLEKALDLVFEAYRTKLPKPGSS